MVSHWLIPLTHYLLLLFIKITTTLILIITSTTKTIIKKIKSLKKTHYLICLLLQRNYKKKLSFKYFEFVTTWINQKKKIKWVDEVNIFRYCRFNLVCLKCMDIYKICLGRKMDSIFCPIPAPSRMVEYHVSLFVKQFIFF